MRVIAAGLMGPEIYRRKVAALQTALADPKTQTEALEVLRGLIERVVLHPADRGFEIELVGEIAAMVDLGALGKAADDVGTLPFIDIDARPLTATSTNPLARHGRTIHRFADGPAMTPESRRTKDWSASS